MPLDSECRAVDARKSGTHGNGDVLLRDLEEDRVGIGAVLESVKCSVLDALAHVDRHVLSALGNGAVRAIKRDDPFADNIDDALLPRQLLQGDRDSLGQTKHGGTALVADW
eukprot:CAMPEP_0119351974 /NCGR_PEP_ID=MMETSP1334-20130426/1258_1 /TAXON_ID=127549 /ORGANISM="Calcidiscus leptoporus, Strain RCC1130" /LENGTH=110 /DNA_ID=CAMNT_0007364899 /DNA_START=481 /DNA_END=810 /DNA_ORIENTATION=-